MASTSLTWTPSNAGSQQKTTLSMWLKKSAASNAGYIFEVSDGSNQFVIRESNAQIKFWHFAGSSYDWEAEISPLLRDTNGWYNFVMSIDTTQSSLADRLKCWLNGVSQTVTFTSGSSNLSQGSNWIFNKNSTHRWGRADNSYWDGYMSHIHQTDGYCYDASTFGSTDATTGEWQINASPTIANYGTNGYWILKDGNSVTDQSPNTNNFTVATGTLTKSEDCPSNIFCTMNPLDRSYNGTAALSNGNTTVTGDGTWQNMRLGTIGVNSGKWYWEIKLNSGNNANMHFGIVPEEWNMGYSSNYFGQTGYYAFTINGSKYANASSSSGSGTFSNGDIVGLALDLDSGTKTLSIYQNTLVSGSVLNLDSTFDGDFWRPMFMGNNSSATAIGYFNFGNGYFGTTAVSSAGTNASGLGIFEYDVPSGYTALCTKGLNE